MSSAKQAARLGFERRDAGQDRGFGLLREAANVAQVARFGSMAQVLEILHAQRFVQELHGSRPHARDAQQLDERRRDLLAKLLVERETAGSRQLRELVADRGADALDARRIAGSVRGHDVDRGMGDRIGGAMVGDGLEDQFALDLEHVADLMEDPRELAVRQGPAAGARIELVGLGFAIGLGLAIVGRLLVVRLDRAHVQALVRDLVGGREPSDSGSR